MALIYFKLLVYAITSTRTHTIQLMRVQMDNRPICVLEKDNLYPGKVVMREILDIKFWNKMEIVPIA